jgi:hypothetical protein
MILHRKIVIFILFLFQFAPGFNQQTFTTSRIIVESGSTVQFQVHSLRRYKEGINLDRWTRLNIFFKDTTDKGATTSATWKLEVKSKYASMYGDNYGRELPLKYLWLKVDFESGTEDLSLNIDPEWFQLTNEYQVLVTDALQGRYKLMISYSLGTEEELMGQPPDYYFVELEFKLSKWAD